MAKFRYNASKVSDSHIYRCCGDECMNMVSIGGEITRWVKDVLDSMVLFRRLGLLSWLWGAFRVS